MLLLTSGGRSKPGGFGACVPYRLSNVFRSIFGKDASCTQCTPLTPLKQALPASRR